MMFMTAIRVKGGGHCSFPMNMGRPLQAAARPGRKKGGRICCRMGGCMWSMHRFDRSPQHRRPIDTYLTWSKGVLAFLLLPPRLCCALAAASGKQRRPNPFSCAFDDRSINVKRLRREESVPPHDWDQFPSTTENSARFVSWFACPPIALHLPPLSLARAITCIFAIIPPKKSKT